MTRIDGKRSQEDAILPEAAAWRGALARLYAELEAEIARLAPVCEISGRCCRFAEFDHALYLSSVEYAVLVADAPRGEEGVDGIERCPWQDDRGRCRAREARPLGCRVYFCDPSYQSAMFDISESYIHKLKQLITEGGEAWRYASLAAQLSAYGTDSAGLRKLEGVEIGAVAVAHQPQSTEESLGFAIGSVTVDPRRSGEADAPREILFS